MAKDFSHAEPELREALRLDPRDNFVHYYLALLALATGRDADALEQAARAGSLIDNDPEANSGLVAAEIRLGHAEAALSRIASMETTNQLSLAREYSFAVLLTQHSFYNQALHCFQRIASLDPSWESRYNLALAMLYDGQFAEASTLLDTLHAERPANADALTFLGSAYEMQQKIPEALEAYRAAAIADPSNPDRTLDYTRLRVPPDQYGGDRSDLSNKTAPGCGGDDQGQLFCRARCLPGCSRHQSRPRCGICGSGPDLCSRRQRR